MKSKRIQWFVFAVLIAALGMWSLALMGQTKHAESAFSERPQPPPRDQPTLVAPSASLALDAGRARSTPFDKREAESTPIPPAVEPAVNRVLASARYGEADHQLGIQTPASGYDGDTYPPQGFAPLDDGRLIVLDTAKTRLVWFGADGRMQRTLALPPELLLPVDVVVTKDGTIVVVDHEGVETSGTVMLDAEGRVKARLPQMANGEMTDVYAVGNDIFFRYGGVHKSIKAGDTSGSASDETPSLFQQGGIIPGIVAPDGRTVVDAMIHGPDKTDLFVNVIRGSRPEHVLSRLYSLEEKIGSVHAVQSDGNGVIYVVFYPGGRPSLLCLDGKTGDFIGHVLLPRDNGHGWPFSQWVVLESGGLVMQEVELDGSTYRFIDCRPSA